MLESFAQAKNIISQGSFAVPNTASVKKVSTKERIPYHKPITEFTKKEISLLRHEFKNAKKDWKEYKDMDFEDQCFYYADYLIPETKKLKKRKKQTNKKTFITYVEFAKGQALLSDKHADHLIKDAAHYLNEVFEAQYKSENYLYLKETVKAFKKDPEGDKNAERYQRISPIYKEELEKEIAEEKSFKLGKAIVLTYFTWLQLGLCQTRVYYPGNPNKPLDPNTIDMPATLEDIHYCLSAAMNVLSAVFNTIDVQTTLFFSLGMLTEAKKVEKVEPNAVYRAFPEFKLGTTKYSEAEEREICKAYKMIPSSLYAYLQDCYKEKCIIIAGEGHHNWVLMPKLMLVNWLSYWLPTQNNIKSVTFLQEISVNTQAAYQELVQYMANLNQSFSIFNSLSSQGINQSNQKKYLEEVYHRLCLNFLQKESNTPPITPRTAFECVATLAKSHGFEMLLSDMSASRDPAQCPREAFMQHGTPTVTIASYSERKTVQHELFSHHERECIDKIITRDALKQIRNLSSNLLVIFTGIFHAVAIRDALQAKGYHSTVVKLLPPLERTADTLIPHPELATNCIMPIDQCEEIDISSAKKHRVNYCVKARPHDDKDCHRDLHTLLSSEYQCAVDTQDLPTIPNAVPTPNNLHYFFAPKQCIKQIKHDVKTPPKTTEQADQLKQEKRQVMG